MLNTASSVATRPPVTTTAAVTSGSSASEMESVNTCTANPPVTMRKAGSIMLKVEGGSCGKTVALFIEANSTLNHDCGVAVMVVAARST